MSKFSFRFSPDILRRLGEELNPSPARGLIELVRNSYDADAKRCHINLKQTVDPGGTIVISDDGDGMSPFEIENGWFVLGRSKKSRQATRTGRIPVGDKGLGRLAALRLGKCVHVSTRHRDNPEVEYCFTIDWDKFSTVDIIGDVKFTVQSHRVPKTTGSGTNITIHGLKDRLGRREVKKLARELVLLADPFGSDPSGFSPTLESPDFEDLERLVQHRYFEDAEYILHAHVMGDGYAQAEVVDYRGRKLYEAEHADLRPKGALMPYRCPPCDMSLWVYILQANRFTTRVATLSGVREWLGAFGGVHIYQNGVRVPPYGDTGMDWLEMNLMRAKSPELTPSTNTSIGLVKVRDLNDSLVQKTDRSGFIENDTYREMQLFGQDALKWMQRRRVEERDRRRADERKRSQAEAKKARHGVESAIKEAPPRSRRSIEKAFANYERKRDREAQSLRREVQLYRTLSTAGIAAAVFAHESANNPVKVIKQSTRTISRRTKQLLSKSKYEESIHEPIERVLRSADALTALSSVTLSLLAHEKRRATRVDVYPVIDRVLEIFDAFLTTRKVSIEWQADDGNPYLRGNEAALEAVFTNLLSNSLQALERASGTARMIAIITTIEDGPTLEIRFRDSGPGIEGIRIKEMWMAGETTRENGTGLGLAIVKDTIRDLGGTTAANSNCELGGAEIIVRLPLLGV